MFIQTNVQPMPLKMHDYLSMKSLKHCLEQCSLAPFRPISTVSIQMFDFEHHKDK